MHHCLPIGQFIKNQTLSVQFSYIVLYAPVGRVQIERNETDSLFALYSTVPAICVKNIGLQIKNIKNVYFLLV